MPDPEPVVDPNVARRAYERARADRWGLDASAWEDALRRSVCSRFDGREADAGAVRAYLDGLHLEDLALAAACAEGRGLAWDEFVLRYRPILYRAADAVRGPGDAREVADSMYADLFGLESREGQRRSLLRYYHGRSSLAGWLRSVFAQRIVDRVRATRRLVPIDEPDGARDDDFGRVPVEERRSRALGERAVSLQASPEVDPHRARLLTAFHAALAATVASLDAGLRLRMALYYAQGMKLAAIGRLVGESEATVSRRLDRARQQIRAEVTRRLRDEHRLADVQIALVFEDAIADGAFDLREVLPAPDS